jgi:hypothetical protein
MAFALKHHEQAHKAHASVTYKLEAVPNNALPLNMFTAPICSMLASADTADRKIIGYASPHGNRSSLDDMLQLIKCRPDYLSAAAWETHRTSRKPHMEYYR